MIYICEGEYELLFYFWVWDTLVNIVHSKSINFPTNFMVSFSLELKCSSGCMYQIIIIHSSGDDIKVSSIFLLP